MTWKVLLIALSIVMGACVSARPPLVATETVEIKVPVRPDIPAQILEPCLPDARLPADMRVRDLDRWAEDLAIALEVCNSNLDKMREALSPP